VSGSASAPRLLVTGFRPGPSGVGRVMMNLINGFAREGVEVHVLVPPGGFPELGASPEVVHLHERSMGLQADAVRQIHDFLAELSPEAVLSNRDEANALVVAAREDLSPRPRVLLRIGTDISAKLRNQSLVSRWRRRRELKRVYRRADLLICNSEGAASGLRDVLGRRGPPITTLYNPLDVDRCRRLAELQPEHPWFRARLGRLLVSVGRLARIKDQATMLRALALLPPDFRLVIFGEGRQKDRLLALAGRLGVAERFDLPGHTDNPFAHLARADVFVLSSLFEGSPNSLLEALAVGTPAVSTDCPSGPREILEEGRYGRLVPVGHPRALAEAVLDVLERPPTASMLEEALSRFDLARAVQAYLRAMGFQGGLQSSGSAR
jgi:glycosyltransferase involved in cell wall biosynthesis